MRLLVLLTLLSLGFPLQQSPLREAHRLYQAGQYQASVKAYLLSLRAYPDQGALIRFNLAQAYLRMDSLDQALRLFQRLTNAQQPEMASQAANNAAVIQVRQGRYPEALRGFRRALIFDDGNETARYNFELLSKRMQPPPQDSLPPDQQSPPEAPSRPEIDEETFRNIIEQLQRNHTLGADDRGRPVGNDTISLDEARRLLERLEQQDMQFIQQLRKVPLSSPRPKTRQQW